ncbi:MAG: anaerobic carbon-monoxide dehydrogenase catalytic subunit [Lentisphaeria bacterium]|nr:anaerobic carbon-monoxide dehydrogenase catalytic subunit [Lentisphaeria bacterium]
MTKADALRPEDRANDRASLEVLLKAERDGVETCFHRFQNLGAQCRFGTSGVCCRICHMGPCRITPKNPRGICGATADTIVARNFLREVVGGTAAHSDHARHLVLRLKAVAEGHGGDYRIADAPALKRYAARYGIPTDNRPEQDTARDLAAVFLAEFTAQEENLRTLTLAPLRQQQRWARHGVVPQGIDRMCVESMHRTHMGVDHDYRNLLGQAFRTAIADGWGGSRIASMCSDILFGTPRPVRSQANLGVLSGTKVNIIVHGHEPELSEMLAVAAHAPDITAYARDVGAEGVNLAGLCCTANEILMRRGVPIAGNFHQQELAIITGAVEMMVVDVQCVMPSLPEVAAAYHTEVVSTADIARTIGATHVSFQADNALESAKTILRRAIDNFRRRDPAKVAIPDDRNPLVAGFSVEAIRTMLGGRFRASFRPLNDAIIQGRIRGIAGVVGCNNPKTRADAYIGTLTRELVRRNVLVLQTGCAAQASAKTGWMRPETALEHAGDSLREVCEAIGIPPILHMGSCVDNARILEAAAEIVREGGLGDDIGGLPAVGVAPEWMSEKAVAIGTYFVASGVDVILGLPFHISGSDKVTAYLQQEAREMFGGAFHDEPDPLAAVDTILALIEEAREKLGINRKTERKLFDMKDRRALNV